MTADPSLVFDLAFDGVLALDPSGDLADTTTAACLPADLARAIASERGSVPYHPDDGASAESAEGSSGATTADLARRARTQVGRDPDVLRVGDVSARVASDGTVVIGLSATTRRSPAAPESFTLTLP